MPFLIRYDVDGTMREIELNPAPSDVDYPEAEAMTITASIEGNPIIQRPMRDGRVRKWIFRGWGKGSEPYETQWNTLQSLTSGHRSQNGQDPYVYLWEDVSGVGGFDRYDSEGNRVFTRVRIAQANRVPRNGGGPVRYDSTLEFYIADDTYTSF